jgi:ABC-type glycerol-3-phosphate transport system substrate-binding protein
LLSLGDPVTLTTSLWNYAMMRLGFFALVAVAVATASAQTPQPKIEVSASGTGTSQGNGTVTVSGSLTIPAGWQLSIHTVTVRFQKDGGGKTLNALIPVKGSNFTQKVDLKSGSYKIWAVIDVKDTDGREKQISSEPQSVAIP